jgi:surface protein
MTTNGKLFFGNKLLTPPAGWQRPSDWLPLVDIDQGFSGLWAVHNVDANFAAFTVAGAYSVDWGDGTPLETYATGVTAYHNYKWSDLSGATLTSEGYRQAVVTVLPQSGQTITSINLAVKHDQSGLPNNYATGWLDLDINAPSISSLTIGSASANVRHFNLEQCRIRSIGTISAPTGLFRSCVKLQSIPVFDASGLINMTGMFQGCSSLEDLPLLNTSNATIMQDAFRGCSSLQTIPLIDTGKVTNFVRFFLDCVSLISVPALDMSSATNMTDTFRGCSSLKIIPAIALTANPTLSNTFISSPSISKVGLSAIRRNVSFENLSLSGAALDEIYTNIGDLTGQTLQTIIVTGNYGIATHNASIATNKNWAVTTT